jgi:hypothetical protein
MTSRGRRSILLLCDDDRRHAATVLDHIAAFRRYSRNNVRIFNPRIGDGGEELDLDEFDVVVIHYSLVVIFDSYLPERLRERLANYRGLKVQFIQDEYRWIDRITETMRELGIHLLYTLVPPGEVDKVYGERVPLVMPVTTLAGYVPEEIVGRRVPPAGERPFDIGYRGRAVPYWLGRLGQEKVEIARGVRERAARHGLRCDIEWTESDRIYGERWNRFLMSCRATLGTESGASIADYDGSIEERVKAYLNHHPSASFDEVERDVLAPLEGNVVINVISPRQFEAAALRTALILFPGEYSGAIEPWTHYLPLEKDFSNLREVADRLRDLRFLDQMTDRAYADLVASGRYSLRRFVSEFDDLVERFSEPRAQRHVTPAKTRFRPATLRQTAMQARSRVAQAKSLGRDALLGGVSTAVLARNVVLRRLAQRYLLDRAARRLVSVSRMREDLFKLVLLTEAHAGRLTPDPFAIQLHYDSERERLVFSSHPSEENLPFESEPGAARRAREAVSAGRLRELVWNHSNVGLTFPVLLTSNRLTNVPIGYYGIYGAHQFSAVVRLQERLRSQVAASLEPLLRPPVRRPAPARQESRAASSHVGRRRLAANPGAYARRACLALDVVLGRRASRRLLFRYIRDVRLRRCVGAHELLGDLVKLGLMEDTHRGRLRSLENVRIEPDLGAEEGTLILRSIANDRDPVMHPESVGALQFRRIVWDHSAVGTRIPYSKRPAGPVEISLEPRGIYEFHALAACARCDPTSVAAAIEPFLATRAAHDSIGR